MTNIALLQGCVGKKETKISKNGNELTMLSIATNKSFKDASGVKQETTTWHNVVCFQKLSDIATKYINVGDRIFVQGEIQNKKIEGGERDGQYMYSVIANNIEFIPSGKKSEEKQKTQTTSDFEDCEIPF